MDSKTRYLNELHDKVIKKRHQELSAKNLFFHIAEYCFDSIYLLRKFGFKRFINFWYTKFFIVDEGGEFDLNYKRIRSNPSILKKPAKIELEITTICNKKCVLCSHTYWPYPKNRMDFNQYKKIIDDIPSLRWINFAGIGSNILNKDFFKILQYASERNLNINLVDEFEFLTKEKSLEIVKLGVNCIYVSLDAADKDSYNKMKTGCDFNKSMKNIKDLLDVKREMKSSFPVLHFRFIINKSNYEQMPAYLDLINTLQPKGARSRVEFIGVITFPEIQDYYVAIEDVPLEIKTEVYKKALQYKINLHFSHASVAPPLMDRCIRWSEPFILVTGEVIPCCSVLLQSKRDFLVKYSFGNALEQNFMDIWNSEKYRNFRDQVVNPSSPVPMICKDCCSHDHSKRASEFGYSE